jgi:hypothetical protein
MGWKGVGLDYPKPGWCSCRGALLSGNGLNCSDSDFLSMCVSIWFSVENYHRLGVCFGHSPGVAPYLMNDRNLELEGF